MLAESRHSRSLSPRDNCVYKIECSSRALTADSGPPPTAPGPALPGAGWIFHVLTEQMNKITNDFRTSNSEANTFGVSIITEEAGVWDLLDSLSPRDKNTFRSRQSTFPAYSTAASYISGSVSGGGKQLDSVDACPVVADNQLRLGPSPLWLLPGWAWVSNLTLLNHRGSIQPTLTLSGYESQEVKCWHLYCLVKIRNIELSVIHFW